MEGIQEETTMQELITSPGGKEVWAQLTLPQRQRLAALLGGWVRRRRAAGSEVRPRGIDPGGEDHERDE
jgi:hypothetical protein